MTQHTPGLWTYEAEETGFAGAIVAKTGWICDFDTDPSPANARLIAAAPDLLEALEAVKNWDVANLALDIPLDVRQKMQAAIAKATGEK